MVVDAVVDLTRTRWYMALTGLALVVVGIAGVQNPGTWVLNAGTVGSILGVLPDVVHQALGALFVVGGATQIGDATGVY